MLAGSLVNAQLSPAGVIRKTEHYLVRKTVPRGPWGHTVEAKFERDGNRRQKECASLPSQHTSPRSIWPIISHPGDGYGATNGELWLQVRTSSRKQSPQKTEKTLFSCKCLQ